MACVCVKSTGCGVRGHSNVWLSSIWCMLLGHVCLLLTNDFHECNGREKGPLLGQKKGQPATINAYQGSRHVATAGQKPNTHTFPFCLYKCFSKLFLSHFICLVYVSIKSFNPSFGWTEKIHRRHVNAHQSGINRVLCCVYCCVGDGFRRMHVRLWNLYSDFNDGERRCVYSGLCPCKPFPDSVKIFFC